MRKGWKNLLGFMLFGLVLMLNKHSAVAANSEGNVNVTVQADVQIEFLQDGSNRVSNCMVDNKTLVPIEVCSIKLSECNGWDLVPDNTYIYADTKQLALSLEGQSLQEGQNKTTHVIPEQSVEELKMDIKRGAWTHSAKSEKALCLEIEYELGTKEFQLDFDENGSPESIASVNARNGEVIRLPIPQREGYDFAGWKDDNGQLYTDDYVMPIGDSTLVAVWKEKKAYAIYSEQDYSLTFVKTSEEPLKGEEHNGKSVDKVYSGFEENEYTNYNQVPWYKDGIHKSIERVMAEAEIAPVSTAYWFYCFESCMDFDLAKVNTAQVEDMQYMFYRAGRLGKGDFIIRGMEDWDVGNVTNMQFMFSTTGLDATSYDIGDIGMWNVGNVTSMLSMFSNAGIRASYFAIGDLSEWNTSKVTNMASMFSSAGEEAEAFHIGNIGKWNVSSVNSMSNMFWQAGEHAGSFCIGDIGDWDVSNVVSMSHMFAYAGYQAEVFEIGNLASWNVENVTKFTATFWCAGVNAEWHLDCSNWNVKKAIHYDSFHSGVEEKVLPPKWVN